MVEFNAEMSAYVMHGVFNQTNDVRAREDVVRILVIDLVHHGVDDKQRDDGKGEGNEGHPPRWNASRTTGEHGGFSATAQFCTHEDVAPITQVLHGPTRARAGVFNAYFGVFCIVDKRQERKGLLRDGVFKFHAFGLCGHGNRGGSVSFFVDRQGEFEFVVAFRKFRIGGFEIGSPIGLVGFIDASNGLVGAVVFVDNRFCSLVHDGEEGVIEVGFTVGEVMTCD